MKFDWSSFDRGISISTFKTKKDESKEEINIKNLAIFFGENPSENRTIVSFSRESLNKTIAKAIKNVIGIVKISTLGNKKRYSLPSSKNVILITEVMRAIWMKYITEVTKKSVKKSEPNTDTN
jgi:hypothetical protein